jgi:hypothetical protein
MKGGNGAAAGVIICCGRALNLRRVLYQVQIVTRSALHMQQRILLQCTKRISCCGVDRYVRRSGCVGDSCCCGSCCAAVGCRAVIWLLLVLSPVLPAPLLASPLLLLLLLLAAAAAG